jgi:hypothetical protein
VVVKSDEHIGYIDWFGVIKKIIALDYLGRKLFCLSVTGLKYRLKVGTKIEGTRRMSMDLSMLM